MADRRSRPRLSGARRLLVVFAASVFLPAVVLAALAYGQVGRERRALAAERAGKIHRAENLLAADLESEVRALRVQEEQRPWYHYNAFYYDPDAVGQGVNYLRSPLAGDPSNPLVAGYFQVDPKGEITSPGDPGPGQTAQQTDGPMPQQAKAQQEIAQSVEQQLLPNLGSRRAGMPESEKGQFLDRQGEGKAQRVGRKGLEANSAVNEKIHQIRESVPPLRGESIQDDGRSFEVVVSPLRFEADREGGVLAWRYADVPWPASDMGVQTFDRFVQGFRLDMHDLTDVLFPRLAARAVDVEAARAEIGYAPDGSPEGARAIAGLPGWWLAVRDTDPGWVGRRVARFSRLLLGASAILLLAIAGGLLFTLRAVREELRLARRRTDFVAAVTHELRTPLTGIKMYADLLREGWVKDDATRDEYVGFMAEETDRLARLVNRVLDFSRSERRPADLRAIDLEPVLRAVERDFGPRLADEGFDMRVVVEGAPRALADEDAVKQILLNLLDNARKYAVGAADRTIEMRVGIDGHAVVLAVADRGPGIPAAERERIFEDFYRPGEVLTRESPGAGIGLALVRRLAESMGGRVSVGETPGGGATFRVRLRTE